MLVSSFFKFIEVNLVNVLKDLRKSNQHGNEIVTDRQLMEVHAAVMQ
jgi:hypothetical protein